MNLFLTFVFLLFIGFFELFIARQLKSKTKVSDTSGDRAFRWGRNIILILFLVALPFIIDTSAHLKIGLIAYVTALMGFQAFMEWKFIKSSRDYQVTLCSLIVGVFILINIENILNFSGIG